MSVAAPAAPAGTSPRRQERALWTVLGVAVIVLVPAAVLRLEANPLLGALVVGLVVVAYQRMLLAWQTLLGAILVVILFVPIRRYTVAGGAPVELEPYRLLIALVLAGWLCALAVDPQVRWRRTGLEGPIVAVVLAIVASLVANVGRVDATAAFVVKQGSFFASFLLVVVFIASVTAPGRHLDRMLRLLVGGGAIVAVLSLVEWRTGVNFFNWYGRVVPGLVFNDQGAAIARGSGVRAMGSAQHPIALGAALVMLLPLAIHLFRRDRHPGWMAAAGVLTLGALSTGSRTATTMLIALLVTFVCLRPRDSRRLLPWLLPLVVVAQIVMPGTLGTFRAILQPSYLIKEQSVAGGSGQGRLADLGPALDEWSRTPFLGQGFGTRVTNAEGATSQSPTGAQILDDQWLGILLELGLAGALAWAWLFGRAIRRLGRRARSDPGPDGSLAAALAASLAALATGMLTFDAFAFIQVMFLGFVVLAFGAVALRRPPQADRRLA